MAAGASSAMLHYSIPKHKITYTEVVIYGFSGDTFIVSRDSLIKAFNLLAFQECKEKLHF